MNVLTIRGHAVHRTSNQPLRRYWVVEIADGRARIVRTTSSHDTARASARRRKNQDAKYDFLAPATHLVYDSMADLVTYEAGR